jgi:hypothetical protein
MLGNKDGIKCGAIRNTLGTWGDYEEPHKTTTMQGQEDG